VSTDPLIDVRDVTRDFRGRRGADGRRTVVHALRGVSLGVPRGARLGIVGESGSGKSTLARLMLALDRPTSGSICFDGVDVTGLPERRLRFLREQMQIVFQDPMSSLDPRMKVGDIVTEPLRALRVPGDHRARLHELLDSVGLDAGAAGRYPHQFSGGQRQRIAIARALAPAPQVLVADEAVSALDVSVRAQILNLLADLTRRYELTLVFVSHDLSVVRHVCDRVVVMRSGLVVEAGPTQRVYDAPEQDYTRELLAAVPRLAWRPQR
jgi:ABC-type glutathione transport system ATPase component